MTSDFKIEVKWEDPQGARGEELRATWSRISIVIGGVAVTQVLDKRSETVRDSIYVPAYPLAEWLAYNWWPLLSESGTGDPSSNGGFKRRHNLKFAAEGFAWPDLAFVADGVSVHARWLTHDPEESKTKFIASGAAVIEQSAFQAEITRFLDFVVDRLKAKEVATCSLIEEWEAIRSLERDEIEFCQAAGALGLDPFSLDEGTKEMICKAEAAFPEVAAEFFQAADAASLAEQTEWLAQTIRDLERTPQTEALRLSRTEKELHGEPWEQGYQLAKKARQTLGFTDWSQPLNHGYFKRSELEKLQVFKPHPDLRTDAVSIFNEDGSAHIVGTATLESSRRFIMARSICDYVIDGPRVPLLQTRAGTFRQRRNRAFAAEFLAPWSGICSLFDRHEADYHDVEMLAGHFLVSTKVIEHQLQNNGVRVLSSL